MAKTILGVDLGGTNARVGLVRDDQLGEVRTTRINADGSADQVLDQLFMLIDQVNVHEVTGIGIGVPSVVDVTRGIVYDAQNIPSWKKVPIKSILEERYSVPVLVNNDANCFALGEKYFGKGIDCKSMIGLIVGTGFAGGIIIDGKLYSGASGGAGEFGMIPYLESIYEHYCAGQFFARRTGQTGAEIFRRAVDGDREAVRIFAEFGHHLGEGIKMISYAYDPEIIILGGSVRIAFRFFREAMYESLRSFVYTNSIESLQIEISERQHVAVLGAAALHLDAELVVN